MRKSPAIAHGHRKSHIYLDDGVMCFSLASVKGNLKKKMHPYFSTLFHYISICVFSIYSECRGINIPLQCITNLIEGQQFKEKYWKRSGFMKAYNEIEFAIKSNVVNIRTKNTLKKIH